MKVYVTKYALTQGVFTAEDGDYHPGYPGYVRIEDDPDGFPQYLDKNEWAPNRKSALKQAEGMRRKKIESLREQIERLENLDIEVHE